jgi:hypothetical protein
MSHMTLADARNRLALIWFPVCGAIILVLIFQTVFGAYGDREIEAWRWAMPNFFPTLALMLSVIGAGAIGGGKEENARVSRFFFRVCAGVSYFYLLILIFVLVAPVARHFWFNEAATPQARLATMDSSGIYLGPIQSLVVGALGYLFFRAEEEAPAPQEAKNGSPDESVSEGSSG